MAPVRRKKRDSVMKSSVLMATLTPALCEDGGVFFEQAQHLRFAAGAVDQRQRHGQMPALGQLVGDAVAFGAVLQHQLEVELLRRGARPS